MVRLPYRNPRRATRLSQELMFLAALASGGAAGGPLAERLRAQGGFAGDDAGVFRHWLGEILRLLEEASRLGAPCGPLLRECAAMVRGEERRMGRLKACERQFAFQGAVLAVIPWAAVLAAGPLQWNAPAAGALALQAGGLCIFALMLKRLRGVDGSEGSALRVLLLFTALRLKAGLGMREALEESIAGLPPEGDVGRHWRSWAELRRRGQGEQQKWSPLLEESPRLALALESLESQGAPSTEFILGYADHVEALRTQAWEEKIAVLPSKLSLLLCGVFAPAVFLALLSSLWPILREVLM